MFAANYGKFSLDIFHMHSFKIVDFDAGQEKC